jgi:hypothetical protein
VPLLLGVNTAKAAAPKPAPISYTKAAVTATATPLGIF